MSTPTIDLLLHPVRLRLVHAMSGGRTLTTAQLCQRLPDVSKATVYRQVALLVEGGLLEIDGEQRVGGAIERRYRLRTERAVIDERAGGRSMTLEDHRRGFAAAIAALFAEFNEYLDRDGADPYADSVAYRQFSLWLSEAELASLIAELRTAIMARARLTPGRGRAPYLMSPIIFPAEARPPTDPDS